MAEYTSGQISIAGLGNGTDFSEMISALKKIELTKANQLARWRNDWYTRLDAFDALRKELATFSTYMKTMNTPDKFLVKSAALSSPTVASVTSTTSALPGTYNLEVGQMATNSYASVKTTATSNLSSMTGTDTTFAYEYKGTTRTLNIGADTTLEGLKNIINSDVSNPGVRATILEAGNEFILQLYSAEQGSDTGISIVSGSMDGYDGAWTTMTGSDAKVKFNGFPAGADWYTFKGNNLTAYGMNMNLLSTGTTLITISTDTDKIKENVEEFVAQINKIRTSILDMTKVDEQKSTTDPEYANSQFEMQKGSTLTGNYGVQLLSSMFKTGVMDKAEGFEYLTIFPDGTFTGDMFSSLAQVGIKTDTVQGSTTFGLLVFETNEELITLDQALQMSPDGVAELFTASLKGYSDSDDFVVYQTMTGFTKAGAYDVHYEVDSGGNIINATINGAPASVDPTDGLLGMYDTSNPASGMRLLINDKTVGSHDGTVRVKDGKLTTLINLVDENFLKVYSEDPYTQKGILSILEKQYGDIIKNIDEKIDKENTRIVIWERRMKDRFSRLDATLKTYDGLLAQIESQIAQLPSGSSSKK
ncbi:MAG: flagellar filament capping protein FliD [Deltaproteobacteria bacterium]|jgi:flagellar hook-associated protein 2|nr:flagellar filament capping protein FliD [Deltaproteobacteria bacterium]